MRKAPRVYNDGSGATSIEVPLDRCRNDGPADPFSVRSVAYEIHVTPAVDDGTPDNGSDGGSARE